MKDKCFGVVRTAREERQREERGEEPDEIYLVTQKEIPSLTLDVKNAQGKNFRCKILRKGDRYGVENCVRHDSDKPLLEFFDLTYENDPRFGPDGQFVSRYYVETIMEGNAGLILQGGVPDWKIDAVAMFLVRTWLSKLGLS